jgi:mannose-6-phosphate isomerase-like protein (cupin superfamily)
MNRDHKTKAFDHATAADHETEDSLVITPSPGAPNPGDWHHLPAGGGYSLRSRRVACDRLQFPDGAMVRVVESPVDPVEAPLIMEFVVPSGAMPTAAHVHPHQEETYVVQEGCMEVLIGREWSTFEVGQSVTVPAGTPHAFRNASGVTVTFLNEHRPALRFEEYFRTVHRLAEEGKIKGGFDVRGVLYASVLMEEYGDTMRPVGGIQRVAVGALAVVGRLTGIDPREFAQT